MTSTYSLPILGLPSTRGWVTDYDQTIETFVAPLVGANRKATVVACYHAVRNFDYLSDGVRDPQTVIDRRAGSCSGKHIVLRDCLVALGEVASIETVEGDFASSIPDHVTMPRASFLCARRRDRGAHRFVVWDRGSDSCRLDATWPSSSSSAFGQQGLAGNGDTRLALRPERFVARPRISSIQRQK